MSGRVPKKSLGAALQALSPPLKFCNKLRDLTPDTLLARFASKQGVFYLYWRSATAFPLRVTFPSTEVEEEEEEEEEEEQEKEEEEEEEEEEKEEEEEEEEEDKLYCSGQGRKRGKSRLFRT